MMTNIKNFKLLGVALITVIISIYTYVHSHNFHRKYQRINEFSEFDGTVEDVFNSRGTIYLNINNNYYKISNTKNLNAKPKDLILFIKEGDKIYKQKNKDYMVICKQGKGYYFHINYEVIEERIDSCTQPVGAEMFSVQ